MARRLSLPLSPRAEDPGAPPTVEAMRGRLGGRVTGAEAGRAGEIVRVGRGEPPRLGVLLADAGGSADVLLDGRTVRRTAPTELSVWSGKIPETLSVAAAEVRAFSALEEGSAVRFALEGGEEEEGTLLERCRWGALVERPGGGVVGVGFRRLTPKAPPG